MHLTNFKILNEIERNSVNYCVLFSEFSSFCWGGGGGEL